MRSPGLSCSVCIADLHVAHLLWQSSVEKINRQKLIMPDYYGLEDRPWTADVGFFPRLVAAVIVLSSLKQQM